MAQNDSTKNRNLLSYIKVTLNGIEVIAHVDTGFACTPISMDLAVRSGLIHRIDPRYKSQLISANGNLVDTRGTVMACELNIGGSSFCWPVTVMDDLVATDMIIGSDIMEHMKAKIDFSRKTLLLQVKRKTPYIKVPLVEMDIEDLKVKLFAKKDKYVENSTIMRTNTSEEPDFEFLDRKRRETPRSVFKSFCFRRLRYLTIQINDVYLDAIVDTGASCSLLTRDAITKCGIGHLVDKRFGDTKYCIEGTLKPEEEIRNLSRLVIIDEDILRQLKACVNYKKEELQFHMQNKFIRQAIPHETTSSA